MSASTNGINKLVSLVRAGSIEEVSKFLESYKDHCKVLTGTEITPLSVACELNRGDVIDLLLKCGADPNASPRADGKSPLHFACEHGEWNTSFVRKLLEAGANVDHQSNDGQTALHLASFHGNVEVVRLLLAHFADVTKLDSQQENALCKTRSAPVAKILIDAGSDVDCKMGQPILNAVNNDLTDMVYFLIKSGANLNHDPLVWLANRKKYLRTRRLLIKAGLPPKSGVIRMKSSLARSTSPRALRSREIGESVIQIPTKQKGNLDEPKAKKRKQRSSKIKNLLVEMIRDSSLEQIEEFLKAEVEDCHLRYYLRPLNDREVTPLSVACELNRGDVVELLLHYGADPNVSSGVGGKAPLHFACEHKKWNTCYVRKLLEAGALVDQQSKDGQTALHFASRHGNVEVVRLLLAHYADVSKLDSQKENALCKTESPVVAKLLIDAGSDVNCSCGIPILNAVSKGFSDIVELLIKAGANLNNDPLIWIANRKHYKGVRNLLVKAGISGKSSPVRMKSTRSQSTNPSVLRMREMGMKKRGHALYKHNLRCK